MLSRQTTPKGEANILLTYVCGVAARCCGETRRGCLAPNAAHDLLVHRFKQQSQIMLDTKVGDPVQSHKKPVYLLKSAGSLLGYSHS